jgi:hypothetical protein
VACSWPPPTPPPARSGGHRCHLLLPPQPPRDAQGSHDAHPLLSSLSLARSSSLSPCLLTVAHGCRLEPSFGAAPCSSEKLRRSPTPPSSSPPKKSPGVAAVSPDFSPETRARRRQIRRRRPPSGQTEPAGAPRVSPRSGRTPPRASPLAVAPPLAGLCRRLGAGRAGLCPADLTNVAAYVGLGPPSHSLWVKRPLV